MIVVGFVAAASVGTLVRWQVGVALPRPLGTLLVNLAGSFALGLLHGASDAQATVAGLAGLGALTTFSTLAQELIDMWGSRRREATAYAVATLVGGVGCAWLGIALS